MSSSYFIKLIGFYRALGKPCVVDCKFEYKGRLGECLNTFEELWKEFDQRIADFEVSFNSENFGTNYDDEFPQNLTGETEAIFTVFLPSGDYKFIESLESFLLIDNKLNTGEKVENVYLIKEDFLFGEAEPSDERVQKALQLSLFIAEIYDLANYSDRVEYSGLLKLVFMDTSIDKKTSPIVIEPKIKIEILACSLIDLTVFKSIKDNVSDNAHVQEKQSMFRVSITEVLKDIEESVNSFDFLVQNWELLKETYYGNFECYLTNFSFLKQKKEAAENYITISTKISGTLTSISGKLFGLPISLAITIAILKADKFEGILALLGVAITSLLIALTIYDQKKVLESIRESIDAIFSHTKSQRSGELATLILRHKENLHIQAWRLELAMALLIALSFLPAIVSLGAYIYKFHPAIIDSINNFVKVFMSQLLS